mgnify:CR=1 FL=1
MFGVEKHCLGREERNGALTFVELFKVVFDPYEWKLELSATSNLFIWQAVRFDGFKQTIADGVTAQQSIEQAELHLKMRLKNSFERRVKAARYLESLKEQS